MEWTDLQSERAADYRVVELWGSPQRIGTHHARYLQPVAAPVRPWPWERDRDFLLGCARLLDEFAPWLWQEVATFAEQIGLPPERGMFVRAGALPHGCSAVVWRAADGRVLAGRTYDFYTRMATRHCLLTTPAHGLSHLGMNGGLVGGRYDGVNEAGVFVALHKVMADRPATVAPGIPYHLLPRLVLQGCRSAAEGAEILARVPHLASFNYTLADASGAMIAVECYPGRPVERREVDRVLAVTNHYTAKTLRPYQGARPVEGSERRMRALEQVIGRPGDSWHATEAALTDHEAGVCCHREFGATLWAGIFDLTASRVAYCFGAPCRNPWRPFAFPGS